MKERDAEHDASLERFAEAIARAEVTAARIEAMWARIRIMLDDAQKIDQLLADVFGPDARMVDE